MNKAKELCAMLVTRALKDLDEDEEEIVVDYLNDLNIDVDIDTKPREMCRLLLEKTMEQELGKKVPLSAYANQLLGKITATKSIEEDARKKYELETGRRRKEKELQSKDKVLLGCIPGDPIFTRNLYDIVVNPELGIEILNDGTMQYTSLVSVSENLYNNIFLSLNNPVLEINTSQGLKAYARVGEPHFESNNIIYISPLVGALLKVNVRDGAFIKLCKSLPGIAKVDFTYYGGKEELNNILGELRNKLPSVINAFSYLSLGMILLTEINGKEVQVRVDGLYDNYERPIFAGLIPFGEHDLPFEINPDI